MRALIVTTDGFEDREFSYPYYRLDEAGFDVDVVAPGGDSVTGEYGIEFDADYGFDEYSPSEWAQNYDLLVIPGGRAPERLRTEAPVAADLVGAFDDAGLPIAAICHGAQLLISAGIVDGRDVAGYWSLEVDIENAGANFVDEPAVLDDNLLTGRVPGDLPAFFGRLFEAFEFGVEPVAAPA